ncbi:mCG1050088, partial [Mus musculus]
TPTMKMATLYLGGSSGLTLFRHVCEIVNEPQCLGCSLPNTGVHFPGEFGIFFFWGLHRFHPKTVSHSS